MVLGKMVYYNPNPSSSFQDRPLNSLLVALLYSARGPVHDMRIENGLEKTIWCFQKRVFGGT